MPLILNECREADQIRPFPRGVVILQSTMPVAVLNYLLALKFARNPGEVAEMKMVSTAFSLLTLPILVFAVL